MPYTAIDILKFKTRAEKICMMTCYDATFAKLVEQAGVDLILVGDSLGMVIKGDSNTLNVTVGDIAYHTRAVVRGAPKTHIVADLPFLSYIEPIQAIKNAGELIQAGAHSVKLEGGQHVAPIVKQIIQSGIPVVGHIGLTPQYFHALGGFKIQGRSNAAQAQILADALALQDAGVFALVIEGVPTQLAADITEKLAIPTIGIGAGPSCDGQVLVVYDLLGLITDFKPKFVKQFASGHEVVGNACKNYMSEVKNGTFPNKEHSFLGYAALEA